MRGRYSGRWLDDVDRDPAHLLRSGSGGREGTADVGERLAGLGGQVAGADEVSLSVVGHLPGDEHQPASARDDDLGVGLRCRQLLGVDELERHVGERSLQAARHCLRRDSQARPVSVRAAAVRRER